jgi:hypothetical protein
LLPALRNAKRTCAHAIAGDPTWTCFRHGTRDETADTFVAGHTLTIREKPPRPRTKLKSPVPHCRKSSARTNPNLRAIQPFSGTQTWLQAAQKKAKLVLLPLV